MQGRRTASLDVRCNLDHAELPGQIDRTQAEYTNGLKLEAWIKPEKLTPGRIFDKVTAGGSDGFLFDTKEMRLKTISLMRKVEAGIVFTHLPSDYHSDHRTTANIVETAAMISSLGTVPVKEKALEITPLLYHTSPLTLSDPLGSQIVPPHFFIDIKTAIETKKKMLGYHISQIELMKHMH